ncbi:MAG: hypothetical protein U9N49_00975 [Campylobacterota bacterium]|nr:hypothetical protein [Campylobacterota bacterium]
MIKKFIFLLFILLFFYGCKFKLDSDIKTSHITTINGVVIDNYLKDSIVCIDTNLNSDCSDEIDEHITTTDELGRFAINSNNIPLKAIIIAYSGNDIHTKTPFNYILKNNILNVDKNNALILTSLNTLVTDYQIITNKSLEESKVAIVNYLGNNIEKENITEDLVAHQDLQLDEFMRSLKVLQIIDKINKEIGFDEKEHINSSNSFNLLAKEISENKQLTHTNSIIRDNNKKRNLQCSYTTFNSCLFTIS